MDNRGLAVLLTIAGVLLAASTRAAGGDLSSFPPTSQPVVNWPATADAPGYGEATAHDPHFDNKAVWPCTTGKENYAAYKWPKGRLLTWAHPGQGSSGGKGAKPGSLDVSDPVNWLEDGKPCTKFVLDEKTDILLPPAGTNYTVSLGGAGHPQVYRHLTVCANAGLNGGGDGVGRSIYGNVWIKKGGRTDNQGATRLLGPGHQFFRDDNTADDNRNHPGSRGGGIMCSQYFSFNKEGDGSVEYLGHVSVLDEFGLNCGLVIVGPGSTLQPGRNASPRIAKDGKLALMDGARFGKWINQIGSVDITVNGTIQGGLPDRPLKRDCFLELSYQNNNQTKFYDTPALSAPQRGGGLEDRNVSMVMASGGALKVYGADPKSATLVIRWSGLEYPTEWSFKYHKPNREEVCKLVNDRLKLIPHKSTIMFAAGVVVEGVRFDATAKGGLLLEDPADRGKWKNVTFGPANDAKGDQLFGTIAAAALKRGSY